jgi:hypothetical protein
VQTTLILLICLMSLSGSLLGQEGPSGNADDAGFIQDSAARTWSETDVDFPAGYEESDLQEFQVDNASGRWRYFIARSSLETHDDGVSRFLLVIRSSYGSANSSYEAFRCGKREYRVYAYGDHTGLRATQNASWQRISKSGSDNYRNTLYDDLICNLSNGTPNPAEAVFSAMQDNTRVIPRISPPD